MTVPRKLTLVMVALLMLALCVSASAGVVRTKTSYLTGNMVIGTKGLKCDAVVSKGLDNVFTYEYTLTYTAGVASIHTYKVQNPNTRPYTNAANTDAFTNPPDGSATFVQWLSGAMPVGDVRTFSYKSIYAPMELDVYTIAADTGTSALGKTLGMSGTIPEPSSLAALLFGAVGLVPLVMRRRK